MRNPLAPILTAALVLALAGGVWLFLRYRDASSRYVDLQAAEQASRESYSRTLDAIAEIQDSLDAIAPGDSLLRSKPSSLVTEERLSGPNAKRALERIASLRASILRSRERIQRLEADLHRSGLRVGALQRVISNLRHDLAEKQAALDDMVGRMTELQGRVTGLEAAVAEGRDSLLATSAELEERRHEMATVWYVVGSRRELLKQGFIVMKGGFLGLGGAPVPSSHGPETGLTPIDTDEATVIATRSTRARVLTPQPQASYELRKVDGSVELHILDPGAFRKVRQLIIMTG